MSEKKNDGMDPGDYIFDDEDETRAGAANSGDFDEFDDPQDPFADQAAGSEPEDHDDDSGPPEPIEEQDDEQGAEAYHEEADQGWEDDAGLPLREDLAPAKPQRQSLLQSKKVMYGGIALIMTIAIGFGLLQSLSRQASAPAERVAVQPASPAGPDQAFTPAFGDSGADPYAVEPYDTDLPPAIDDQRAAGPAVQETVQPRLEERQERRVTAGADLHSVTESLSRIEGEIDTLARDLQNHQNRNARFLGEVKRAMESLQKAVEDSGIRSIPAGGQAATGTPDRTAQQQQPQQQAQQQQPAVQRIPDWELQAIVPGRAWVKHTSGRVVTVRVGDALPNGALVNRVDVEGQQVVTDQGVVRE